MKRARSRPRRARRSPLLALLAALAVPASAQVPGPSFQGGAAAPRGPWGGCASGLAATPCFGVPAGESQLQVPDTALAAGPPRWPKPFYDSPTTMPPAGPWLIIGNR